MNYLLMFLLLIALMGSAGAMFSVFKDAELKWAVSIAVAACALSAILIAGHI
tara:strand:+ start:330 stop:485 length:156 start_codon:yes stop_codon:yes gene_type:complete